jgi:hypothetical protein
MASALGHAGDVGRPTAETALEPDPLRMRAEGLGHRPLPRLRLMWSSPARAAIADPGHSGHSQRSGLRGTRLEVITGHTAARLADVWQARHVNGATAYPTELTTYAVDELHFDPENPRIPEVVDGADEEQVLRWMLSDATLLDLMGSIAEHGYFPGEPLLLAPRERGGYTVVEGNRRLAAVRLLLHPDEAPVRQISVQQLADSAPHKPTQVYAVLFPERNSILDYLGFRHITGVKEWDPLAKARYLRQLWDRTDGARDERLRILARKIGSQPWYVKRLLGGLRVFDTIEESNFFDIDGLDRDLSFSLLSTALSFDSLANYLGVSDDSSGAEPLNKDNVEKFTRWVYEEQPGGGTVVGDSRNLKALAAIVDKPEALSLLEQGASLADAALATEHLGQQFTRTLRLARDRLDLAQRLLRRVPEPTDADGELLFEITNAAEDMYSAYRRRARARGRD